jgi:hypothetical protein
MPYATDTLLCAHMHLLHVYHSSAAQSCELLNKTYSATVAAVGGTYKLRRLLSNTLTTYELRNGDPLGYAAKVDGNASTQSLALDLTSNKYQYQVSTATAAAAHRCVRLCTHVA